MPQYIFRGRVSCIAETIVEAPSYAEAVAIAQQRTVQLITSSDVHDTMHEWTVNGPSVTERPTDITFVGEL